MVQSITNNLIFNSQKSFADFGLNTSGSNAPEQIGIGFLRSKCMKKALQRCGDIYIIKSQGYYKIGKSHSFIKSGRLSHYRTHNPDITLVLCQRVRYYTQVEKILHKRYSNKLLRGEWFLLCDNDIRDIEEFILPRITSAVDGVNLAIKLQKNR